MNIMLDELISSVNSMVSQTKNNLPVLGLIVFVLWTAFWITLIDKRILYLGIIPRRLHGLLGIFFAPFLHSDFNHLFFNTIPLIVLSNFLLMNGLEYFLTVTWMITVLSGVLIWCFAKPGLHIGASALITGYWALLVSNIYQQGSLSAIILGLLSIYYFAGIFYGVFPGKKGVSWQGHLFGLLAGCIAGYFYVHRVN